MTGNTFWNLIDELVVHSDVVIDRPKGSAHPRYPDMIYPVNYGYLDGTVSGDGEGIDVRVGSPDGRRVEAIICTVDGLKRDIEVKLLLACSDMEIDLIMQFLERHSIGCLLVRRPIT